MTEPLHITAVLIALADLRNDLELPHPTSLRMTKCNGIATVEVATFGDVMAWADAFGVSHHARHSSTFKSGASAHSAWAEWNGWHVRIAAYVDAPALAVDYLPEPIADARVDEILDKLNGFVAYECDSGTDLVNGRAVPYSDRTGVLDEGFAEAFPWLSLQDDVRLAVCTEDAHEATLTDGTVLFWEPSEQQWVVAAVDAADRAAEISGFVSEHAAAVTR